LRRTSGRHVTDRHLDRSAARLGVHALDHRRRQVDAAHRHASCSEGERDPARPDAELECLAVTGQLGQHVDDRVDHLGRERLGGRLVVSRGHLLREVVLAHRSHSLPTTGPPLS
jgi:hypothetical protein